MYKETMTRAEENIKCQDWNEIYDEANRRLNVSIDEPPIMEVTEMPSAINVKINERRADVGIKFDNEKESRPELLHIDFIDSVSRVLALGAKKYSDDNWKHVSNGFARYSGAALRHIFSAMKGEKADKETGESHLAHATCCLMFMFYFEVKK